MEEKQPVSINLNNFTINIVNKSNESVKSVLHPLTTRIEGGKLLAILGESGSGKTTLLNVLADRYDKKAISVGGSIYFSGVINSVGYVTQQDYLLPYLTVREAITFAAQIRIASDDPRLLDCDDFHEKYNQIVTSIILDLGLIDCSNYRIGDNAEAFSVRCVSGGEKRRVSIATQIVSQPEILCADEPTSGLDAFTAITVMESLKRLTKTSAYQTTIICSIHQPRHDIFQLFDHVLLLSKGYPIYCGEGSRMCSYFESLHYPVPNDCNPGDFFIDISSYDGTSKYTAADSLHRIRLLVLAYSRSCTEVGEKSTITTTTGRSITTPSAYERDTSATQIYNQSADCYKFDSELVHQEYLSAGTQLYLLTRRFSVATFREYMNLFGNICQALFLSLFIMGIFWNLGNNVTDIETRNGLLYLVISMEYYIYMIILVEKYSTQLHIFDCERMDNVYSPTIYFVSHFISSLPQLLVQPVLYGLPIYYGCNLRSGGDHVIVFLLTQILVCFCINGLAWCAVSVCRSFSVASLIANTNFTFITLVAGFLVNVTELPSYVRWVSKTSFLGYAFHILMSNEFSDRIFPGCPYSVESECLQYDGNAILNAQGIATNEYKHVTDWIVLLFIGSSYHLIAMCILQFVQFDYTSSVEVDELPEGDVDIDMNLFVLSDAEKAYDRDSGISQSVTIPAGMENSFKESSDLNAALLSCSQRSTIDASDMTELGRHTSTASQLLKTYSKNQMMSVTVQNLTVSVPRSSYNVETIISRSIEEERSRSTAISKGGTFEAPNHLYTNDAALRNAEEGITTVMAAAVTSGPISCVSSTNHLNRKIILKNISLKAKPCRMVALMGGSGSGKTTLLNLIGARISHSFFVSSESENANFTLSESYVCDGHIRYNGAPYDYHSLRNRMGYVEQYDYHMPLFTVRETLIFHAKLRFEMNIEIEKLAEIVDDILVTLGLVTCRNTRVGSHEVKGISGGEKRRLSVGIQLLMNPAICLLDEPTTGLDSYTSLHIMEMLKDLASKGRTVIFSIHQPRYDIFRLIDDVVLLSQGKQIWCGSTVDMLHHFQLLGYSCPKLTNPADYILDLSSIDYRKETSEIISKARVENLAAAFDVHYNAVLVLIGGSEDGSMQSANDVQAIIEERDSLSQNSGALSDDFKSKERSAVEQSQLSDDSKPLWFTLPLLLSRSVTNLSRQPVLGFTRIAQGMFFALILSTFYAPIGDNQKAVQNIIGNLYELTALCFIGMLNCIAQFPVERNVFYREYPDGAYSVLAFLLSYYIIAIPILIVSAFLVSLLMCFGVGLCTTSESFLLVTIVLFSFMFIGECIGVMFCSIFFHVGFSVNIMSMFLSMINIIAGFIALDMPQFFVWIAYSSPNKWGSIIMTNAVLKDKTFTCSSSEEVQDGQCVYNTGEDVLRQYDMEYGDHFYGSRQFHLIIFGLLVCLYFVLSIVVFRIKAYILSH